MNLGAKDSYLRVERKGASIKFEGFQMTTWPSNWVLRQKSFSWKANSEPRSKLFWTTN